MIVLIPTISFNFGAIWYWQHEFKATQTPQMLPFDARTSRPWRPGERGRGECKSENAPGVTDCKFWTPPPPLRQLQSSPTTFSSLLQTMSSTVMSCLVSDNNNQNGRRSVHTSFSCLYWRSYSETVTPEFDTILCLSTTKVDTTKISLSL